MKREPKKQRGVFERPKGSGIWWIRYVDADGILHREKVGSRAAAIAAYQLRKTQVREGRYFPEKLKNARGLRLAAAIADFLARRDRKPGPDYRRYQKLWLGHLGDRPLSSITSAEIERFAAERRRGHLKGSSVNRELTFLRAVFNLAISDEKLNRANPVKKTAFVSEDLFGRERWLSDDEEERLRKSLGPTKWPIVEVALQTGFRRKVVFGLRWDQIDFENGHARSPAAKRGKTYRVPLSRELRSVLAALPSRSSSEWVFPNGRGGHLDEHNWTTRRFAKAVATAGVRDFTFHDLRHTFATRLAMSGSSLLEIQHLLGHSSPAMTQRYAHFVEAFRRRAISRMDEARAARNRRRSGTRSGTTDRTEQPAKAKGQKVLVPQGPGSEPSGDRTRDPLLKRRTGVKPRTPRKR